jgi:hypothetical protein
MSFIFGNDAQLYLPATRSIATQESLIPGGQIPLKFLEKSA